MHIETEAEGIRRMRDDGTTKTNLKCGNAELVWSNPNEAYVLDLGDDVGQVLVETTDRGTHWVARFQFDEDFLTETHDKQDTADALDKILRAIADRWRGDGTLQAT